MLFRRPEAQPEGSEPHLRPAQQQTLDATTSSTDHRRRANLRTLGVHDDASWSEVEAAYHSLVSDLTPGPDATHSRVKLARQLLDEVDAAFESLRQAGSSETDVA